MAWRRYAYASTNGGLAGANLEELNQPISDNQSAGSRRFGTELTSNIFNNQQRVQHFENRKRTFKQLNERKEEEKESSHDFAEFEQPAKRARYNLRNRKNETSTVSTEILGKENMNYRKPALQKNKTMDVDSDNSEDEDIDLVVHKPKPKPLKVRKTRNKRVRSKVPLRRSLRIKNKRARELKKKNEKNVQQRAFKQIVVKEPEYILDDELLDCDKVHVNDDLFVTEYISDIHRWYLECENTEEQLNLIRNNYISSSFQKDLNDSMRCILLNWLVNVHRRFKLLDSTLFLGVYIMDAYLSLVPIRRDELQLVGSCSMWIASKYHEIYAPEANDFAYISNHAFHRDTLFETEIKILTKLKFKFANIITPLHFIERYLQIATYPLWKKYEARGTQKAIKDGKDYINLVKELTFYFAELSLFDSKLISTTKPSLIAAASLCFAIISISLYPRWPDFLQRHTNYSYQDLKFVLLRLNNIRNYSNTKLTSVRKKHKQYEQWIDRLNINLVINNQG